jgi:polyhydroxybutyrate depolymerase
MAEGSGNWSRYADTHGFLVAFGQGERASWNAGSCCGTAQHTHVDDVDYLVAAVADAARRWPVDRSRVYVVGFSAGDMMAMRAECERPDVFAAASGVAGGLVMRCPASRAQIRIQHLHGMHDVDAVPFGGGVSSVVGLDCGHVWPKVTNACGVDGTDLIWQWVSRFSRPLAGQALAGD